jgi:hypothetical protein
LAHACGRCGGGMVDEAVLCFDCTRGLAGRLADVPVLLAELDNTLARMTATTTSVGSTGHPPGSVHPDMSVAAIAGLLRVSCAGWAHALDRHVSTAPWKHLLKHLPDVRMQNWSVMLDRDLAMRMADGWQRVDRPEERWYAGVCGADIPDARGHALCQQVLWAKLDDSEITCRYCGTIWTVPERRDWLIRTAEDFEGNATMVASVVSYVTQKRVAPATVRSWSFRGLLIPKQRTTTSYRVGDVIEVALRHEVKGKHSAPDVDGVPA